MLGREHALSGVAAGAAFGELVLHLPPSGVAALAGLTGVFVTLPDLDQCESSAARSLGFMSEATATVVGDVSGGHRHATHSFVGIGVFSIAAWAACHYRGDWGGRLGLFLLMALAVAAAIRALGGGGHLGDVAAIGAAAGVVAGAGACTWWRWPARSDARCTSSAT